MWVGGPDFVDILSMVFATPGKDAATIEAFDEHLRAHGGRLPASPAYRVDKFHVMKRVNEAVDEARRTEQVKAPELKKTRYIWLKNEQDLTKEQQDTLATLSASHLRTAKAYQLKIPFQGLWGYPVRMADLFFDLWYYWATHSRLEPMIAVAKTLKAFRDRIFALV